MPFEIANISCEESGSGRAYPDRLVPLGVEHPARLSPFSPWSANSQPLPPGQKEMLLELIGSPRIVNLASVKDPWKLWRAL